MWWKPWMVETSRNFASIFIIFSKGPFLCLMHKGLYANWVTSLLFSLENEAVHWFPIWWFNCFQDNETFLCPWWKPNHVDTNEFADTEFVSALDLSLSECLILLLPRVVLSSGWQREWCGWGADQWVLSPEPGLHNSMSRAQSEGFLLQQMMILGPAPALVSTARPDTALI